MYNITWNGEPLTVLGEQLKVLDRMPSFISVTKDFQPWSLNDVKGIKIISVIPSLDTPVCQIQTRRFNRDATELNGVSVITISLDLPYAQSRWCGAKGVNDIIIISDYKDRQFAKQTSLLINELKLLTRAVFVLDAYNNIKYLEYIKNITEEPNYENAMASVKPLIN